jgi:hypothetical protein
MKGMSINLKYGSYGYSFEVRELGKEEYGEWDSFVDKSPQGTVFHKTSWLQSIDRYGFKIVACTHKESIVAGIPLPYTKRFGVRFGVNPPFTPYLGVIFRESNQKYNVELSFERELSKALTETVKNIAPYVKYKFHCSFVDPLPFVYAGFSVSPSFNYVLSLEGSLASILGDMEKDTRNRIARSSKYNLEFSNSSKEMEKLVYLARASERARKNRTPPIPREGYYERYLDIFSKTNAVRSIIAKDGDNLLAGGTIAYDSKRAYYILAGFNSESKYKGVGPLVIWMLIKHAKETLGLREFDFLIIPNQTAERFYRGFGGKLTQAYVIYKNNNFLRLADTVLRIESRVRLRGRALVS